VQRGFPLAAEHAQMTDASAPDHGRAVGWRQSRKNYLFKRLDQIGDTQIDIGQHVSGLPHQCDELFEKDATGRAKPGQHEILMAVTLGRGPHGLPKVDDRAFVGVEHLIVAQLDGSIRLPDSSS
jgi:hypothetical protein